jgi:hypothetical protein
LKKEAKTFVCLAGWLGRRHIPSEQEFFGSFLQKRTLALLALLLGAAPLPRAAGLAKQAAQDP